MVKNHEKYIAKVKGKNIILEVSPPRSGRNWLRTLVTRVVDMQGNDKTVANIVHVAEKEMESYIYICCHRSDMQLPELKYIVLVRDPRDVLLSNAYTNLVGEEDIKELTSAQIKCKLSRVAHWKAHLDYLNYNSLLVQYEQLCLAPVRTLERVMKFLDKEIVNDISSVVSNRDREKVINDVTERPQIKRVTYATNYERYERHCLKWRRHDAFLPEINEQIWEEYGDLMIKYGYTKEGHDIKQWDIE